MAQDYTLTRDCPATVIPAGDKVTLKAGTKLFITQTLGGNVTVRTEQGLFQIAVADTGLSGAASAAWNTDGVVPERTRRVARTGKRRRCGLDCEWDNAESFHEARDACMAEEANILRRCEEYSAGWIGVAAGKRSGPDARGSRLIAARDRQ